MPPSSNTASAAASEARTAATFATATAIDASAAAAHQADMQEVTSEPGSHRGNILNCGLTRVGISVLPTRDGRQLIGVLFLP